MLKLLSVFLDWRVICVVVAALALYLADANGARRGSAEMLAKWQASELANAELQRNEEAARDDMAGRRGVEFAAEIDRLRRNTERMLKEIMTHVSAETDARYPLPCGLVRLHDAAALGIEPGAVAACAGQPDDATAPVRASDLARVVAANYGRCRGEAERVRQWQKFYEELRARDRAGG